MKWRTCRLSKRSGFSTGRNCDQSSAVGEAADVAFSKTPPVYERNGGRPVFFHGDWQGK